MRATRSVTPWFFAALAAQALLVIADVSSEETFTTVYLLAPLALALVERPRPVALLGLVAFALAVASGTWNDHFWSLGHALRSAIVAVSATLATLSAQARSALYRSQGQAVAARERAEAGGRRLDAILGSLAEAVTVHDEQGKTVYANAAAARLLGADSAEELLSAAPGEVAARFAITGEDGGPVRTDDFPGRRVVSGQSADPLLTRSVVRATGESRWLLTKATTVTDEHGRPLAVNVIEDVTEAKDAELRQRFLAEATKVLSSSLDYDETLERVAWLAVPTFADWCAVDLVTGTEVERVALAHADPDRVALGRSLAERYPPDLSGQVGMGAVMRSGEPELYPRITDELIARGAVDEEQLAGLRSLGMRSALILPMRTVSGTIGTLTLVNGDSERGFDEDDQAFALDLAGRAATAVENARLYTRLSQTATTLQASLLPATLAQPPGWRVAASYVAGEEGTEVGGDFYDVFPVEGGWMVVLGDVTGKGVKAATLTALARHTANTSARFDPRPASVLGRINEVLREQPDLSLVTAVCARLRPAGDGAEVALASAGHPLPLRVAPGHVTPVGRFDIVLGAADDGTWDQTTTTLEPGQTLLFYTDGVVELAGQRDRFGEPRLERTAADGPSGAAELVARVERALDDFQATETSDDRAMLAVEWVGVQQPAVAP